MTTGSVSRHLVFCVFPGEAQRFFLGRDVGSFQRSPHYVVQNVMSLLSSCILSTGKTVESSGVNSLATVTQMWLTQRRPKPYSDRYPYLLIRQAELLLEGLLLEGLATNLQSAVIERLRDVPGRDQWSQNLAKRSTHFLSSGCPILFDDALLNLLVVRHL